MRGKLKTTPERVLLAVLAGWAVLAVGMLGLALLGNTEDPAALHLLLLGVAVLALAPIVFPGIPSWLVCHRLGVRARTAAACGAVSGLLISGAAGASAFLEREVTTSNVIAVLLLTLGGAVAGGLAVWLMWRIAYPKALQPIPPAEHF